MRFLTLTFIASLTLLIAACDDSGSSPAATGTPTTVSGSRANPGDEQRSFIDIQINLREGEMADIARNGGEGRASDTKGFVLDRIAEFRRVMNADLRALEDIIENAGDEWKTKLAELKESLARLDTEIAVLRPMDGLDWEPLKPALKNVDVAFTDVSNRYSELNKRFAEELQAVKYAAPDQQRTSGPSGPPGRPGQ